MKTKLQPFSCLCILLALWSALTFQTSTAFAQGTMFTYQGRLYDGATPANGKYDLRFNVYNTSTLGVVLAGPLITAPVVVSNGLFTVNLDFGVGLFNGQPCWLDIAARSNGVAVAYTTLTPRQQLTPTPYAIFAAGANAAGLSGTIPAGGLSGVNGSGLVGLNASQLTTGTVPNARLPLNVALTDANQTFTGSNVFNRGFGGPGRLIVQGSSGVDLTTFTGLGFQYYDGSGEGALMSSYSDGFSSLSFYTKQGFGYPIAKQMIIDRLGGVAIDQQNANSGVFNDGTTNGVGLSFGAGSGEGLASKRTVGGNQYGLDFYTGYGNRLSISSIGNIFVTDQSQTIIFPATSGANNPMMAMFASGTGNANRMVIAHSPAYPNWGLQYEDSVDRFNFLSGGTPVMSVNLGSQTVGIGTTNPVGAKLEVTGNIRTDGGSILLQPSTAGSFANDGLIFGSFGLPGINSGSGPCLFGYNGGALGAYSPNTVCLSWDYNGNVWVSNNLSTATLTIRGGADLAEPFNITAGESEVPQGAVMVIDAQNPGHLKLSDSPYDTRVAGVISGANGVNAGIQMHQQGLIEGGKNVALTGRVYVQADASNGAIQPGDLLTTSSIPGRAMRVSDHAKAQGAILGKAMTALDEEKGLVLVLVTLQ